MKPAPWLKNVKITLGTAYFLGLKRTYKLALKIQRRLLGPKHPKIRQFLQRKTRSIFDMAPNVHRKVQQRDIEAGRNLGNWILRWLDKMKPGAQIRAGKPTKPDNNKVNPTKRQLTDNCNQKPPQSYGPSYIKNRDQESPSRRHFSSRQYCHAAYPTVDMMIRPVGINTQYRHFNTFEMRNTRLGFDGVIRNDIMWWMMQK
ncbi:hypothetical protein L1987_03069 [Smallanthus sonchifolius]|uniref:Uncharacterized protein n=1 Tax=Smallanthus sonchifolius TaxID=185202 RepID=A0ACB9K9M7_9ASTR|nr:hypothetical protein L1987_03069 [Smallanthus sonchifolius]